MVTLFLLQQMLAGNLRKFQYLTYRFQKKTPCFDTFVKVSIDGIHVHVCLKMSSLKSYRSTANYKVLSESLEQSLESQNSFNLHRL